jgi:hypothetical protein
MDDARAVQRPRASYRLRLVGLALGMALLEQATACESACNDAGQCTFDSGSRLIDDVCVQTLDDGTPACELEGDAEETTGVTADVSGYRLGPKGGTLSIALSAVEGTQFSSGSYDIDVLMAAAEEGGSATVTATLVQSGCTDPSCPGLPTVTTRVDYDYAWITVVQSAQASTGGFLVLTGAGVDIADIHSSARYLETGCSVAADSFAPRRSRGAPPR